MKALRFNEYGEPGVLHLDEVAIPVPLSGEVLVSVSAAAINPADIKNVAGLFLAALPRTPGRDFAGTVISEGEWYGRQVWGSGAGFGIIRDGAQAEYLTIPQQWLSAKPESLSMAQAATVGVPFITAWSALVLVGNIQPGETLLVTGSGGAVGQAAVQIAHWKGARVIGVGHSDGQNNTDIYINARTQDVLHEVAKATDKQGVDIALDTVGGPMFETTLRSLRQGGRHIVITNTGTQHVEFDLAYFYHHQLHLAGVDTMKLSGNDIASILNALRVGFDGGFLHPLEHAVKRPENGIEAYLETISGNRTKKQVITFS